MRRGHYEHRVALVAKSSEEMVDRLGAFLAAERGRGIAVGRRPGEKGPKVAFVFAGIGMFIIGLIVLAGLVIAAVSLPFLLFLLIPLAIVWGFVALIRPRPPAV